LRGAAAAAARGGGGGARGGGGVTARAPARSPRWLSLSLSSPPPFRAVATVEVVETASALIVKALAEPERDRKKGPKGVKHNGNLTLKQVRSLLPHSVWCPRPSHSSAAAVFFSFLF
jgi:hypothetical protein